MARTPTAQKVFDALVKKYDAHIADAFARAMQDLSSGADLARIIQAISDGNLADALDAMHLDPAALTPLRQAIQEAYGSGGTFGAGQITAAGSRAGLRFVFRFDLGNYRAENWLRTHSGNLITRIMDDQRTSIRAALAAGLREGRNPRSVALDIVGRINRATGKRENGLIGLTSQQAEYVRSAQTELGSGDAALLRNYLGRNLRDKRFDPVVRRAIENGDIISVSTIEGASGSYANRMLKYRGDLIGTQESFSALSTARHETYLQAIDKGIASYQTITKKWRHFPNEHPRMQHIAMNGVSVPIQQRFRLPDGTLMKFPHDPDAPIYQTAGCHCQADYRIDFLAGVE